MCDICGYRECPPMCPQYRKTSYGVCTLCGEDVARNDRFVEIGARVAHRGCLQNMMVDKPTYTLNLLGYEVLIAGR